MLITKYSDLAFFINMFKNGNCDLLIIESKGGLGKSRFFESVMTEEPYLRILSHITPMQLFILGYKKKNMPILVDDVDGLMHSDDTISLLKMFCETREIKEVSWHTTSSLLKSAEVPPSYETKAKVCMLTNDFKGLTKKISALRDRGWYLQFKPTDEEILNKIKEIIHDVPSKLPLEEKLEVFNLLKDYSRFCDFSLRTFVKGLHLCTECKGKGVSWKQILLNEMKINPKLVLLNELIKKYPSDKERVKEWENKGFSRRSFYDYKHILVHKCGGLENMEDYLTNEI
jgi:hypothetical protein